MAVIACDLDGTLLSDCITVSEENLAAIERLAKKGVTLCIATGRTFYEIPKVLLENPYIKYFIYSNGAGIYENLKGIIYSSPIEAETAKEVFELLNSYSTFIEVYTNGNPLVDSEKFNEAGFAKYRIDESFLPELLRSRKPVENFIEKINNAPREIEMFDVFFRHMREREECLRKIRHCFGQLETTSSMRNNLEIMNSGINKGSALEKLCEIAGFSTAEVIALGDSKNDIAMFNTAGKCFSVSNACDELKERSTAVICSNKENVICYVEKYLEENGF